MSAAMALWTERHDVESNGWVQISKLVPLKA